MTLVNRYDGSEQQPTKRNSSCRNFGCIGLMVLALIFIAIGSMNDSSTDIANNDTQKTESKALSTEEQTGNEAATESLPSDLTYEEVTSWEKLGKTWHAILFSRKPTDNELINIARDLHSKNNTYYYNLFDDDEKLEEFKDWDVNYSKTTDKNAFPYPEEWAETHDLGLINEVYSSGGLKWRLSDSYGFKIIDL